MSKLLTLTLVQDAQDVTVVGSWVSNLVALTTSLEQLTTSATTSALSIAMASISASASFDAVSGVAPALDAIISSFLAQSRGDERRARSRRLSDRSQSSVITSVLDAMGLLTTSTMIAGQDPVSITQQNYRMVSMVMGASAQPRSLLRDYKASCPRLCP